MSFSINLGVWNSVFAVPCSLVDQHIKLAGALQLKVLLWVLRHAGESLTVEGVAKSLGANPADVKDAMSYWTETGMIAESSGTENYAPGKATPKAEAREPAVPSPPAAQPDRLAEQPKPEPHAAPPKRMPKPDGVFIAERISQSQEIGFLMQESQQILGRPISPGLSSTLLLLHDDYGLPADVILMLLQYVKSRGKDNTSYIETVGRNWSAENILSHQMAEEKLRKLDEIAGAWRVIEQTVGISHRSPSTREEQYANRWILEWKFSSKMVREAYERCVNATGKLSMSYMNRILERWQKEGVFTPEQAALEQDEKAKTTQKGKEAATYDIEEFERLSFGELDRYAKG